MMVTYDIGDFVLMGWGAAHFCGIVDGFCGRLCM